MQLHGAFLLRLHRNSATLKHYAVDVLESYGSCAADARAIVAICFGFEHIHLVPQCPTDDAVPCTIINASLPAALIVFWSGCVNHCTELFRCGVCAVPSMLESA